MKLDHSCHHLARETAIQKVRLAEDGWGSCDLQPVSLVYTPE
ncbi:DUF1348 family protein [Methylotenera sp. L2L1]|nr:DUF1348 family protein [Methylotenera sp. L2L1]